MSNSQPADENVSLTIKVPEPWRRHWQIEAKKRGVSVTELIVTALTKELGLPEEKKDNKT